MFWGSFYLTGQPRSMRELKFGMVMIVIWSAVAVKFFESLKQSNETLAQRIVFVTGDAVSPETRAFLNDTGNHWSSKPFNIQQVIDAVDSMLDKKATTA